MPTRWTSNTHLTRNLPTLNNSHGNTCNKRNPRSSLPNRRTRRHANKYDNQRSPRQSNDRILIWHKVTHRRCERKNQRPHHDNREPPTQAINTITKPTKTKHNDLCINPNQPTTTCQPKTRRKRRNKGLTVFTRRNKRDKNLTFQHYTA